MFLKATFTFLFVPLAQHVASILGNNIVYFCPTLRKIFCAICVNVLNEHGIRVSKGWRHKIKEIQCQLTYKRWMYFQKIKIKFSVYRSFGHRFQHWHLTLLLSEKSSHVFNVGGFFCLKLIYPPEKKTSWISNFVYIFPRSSNSHTYLFNLRNSIIYDHLLESPSKCNVFAECPAFSCCAQCSGPYYLTAASSDS